MTSRLPWARLARLPAAELRRLRDAQLARFVREELYPFSAHYRRVLDAAGVEPRQVRGVDDLRRLPFTVKKDLLDAQSDPERKRDFILIPSPETIRAHWPFGRKLALVLGGERARVALRRAYTPSFLTFTTGRSSDPVAFAYTPHDLEVLAEAGGRIWDMLGASEPGTRVLNVFPFAPHLAFWQVTWAGFETGCLVLPTGGGKVMGTSGNLRMLGRSQPHMIVGTPGFVYHLLRAAREQALSLPEIRTVVLGAEKVTPGLKHKIIETLEAMGAREPRVVGTYGFTEARMAFAECPTGPEHSSGYHLFPDLGVLEVIDPETLEPVADGEDGELVYTGVSGHGTSVLRYRTGDMAIGGVTWEPCPHCGRTLPRASSELRRVTDRHALSLTKIKGTLVDLSQMGSVLSGLEGIEEWQVVIQKKNDDPHELDELEVRVSSRNGTDRAELEKRLRDELATQTEVSPNRVSFLPLPELLAELGMESELKEKRFLDRRPKD